MWMMMKTTQHVKCLRFMNSCPLPLPLPKGRGVVSIVLLLFSICGFAQSNHDFGFDLSAGAEKKITKNLSFSLDVNARTQNDTKSMERWAVGGAFDYKIVNTKRFDLKASAGWEYIWQKRLGETTLHTTTDTYNTPSGVIEETTCDGFNSFSAYWRNRHRTTVAFTGTYSPTKRWNFSLRESVQYNHYCKATQAKTKYRNDDLDEDATIDDIMNDEDTEVSYDTKEYSSKDRFVLRSKLTVQYNIKHSIFSPYASCDYGCGLNYSTSKWKIAAGSEIDLAKQHKLDVFYRYQTENDDDEPKGHIVGVGYKFKF